ncbi:DNA ligase (NAD+) [Abyssogena phaseoliformis symbiont OG214]|nr:DNA ligase (NAD+) [Abyssogena phaseoliformis symbiont OG214]
MMLSQDIVDKLIHQEVLVDELSDEELAQFCQIANLAYRAGKPIISDQDYDFIYLAALKDRDPNNPLLKSIEPEGQVFSEEKVLLPEVMLSIDKAYLWDKVSKWIERLEKSAMQIGLDLSNIQIKATPKLDGFAGFDDGNRLYTRGDGKKGSDISRVFERGLCVFNDAERGLGAGEIVIKKSYFEKYLAHSFEYPRNFQASLIKEKTLDKQAQKAIINKAALFVPFVQLPTWSGLVAELVAKFDQIVAQVLVMVDFDVDGVVFEVINADLKTQMGANRKFHRWQIAFKENKDKAQVQVLSVTPQVGRSGKITPVAELEPTLLSGATIVRATGHHYGLVKEQGLGAGSVVELTRSGLVIPKIISVLKPMPVDIPDNCPSCDKPLVWESDFLMCTNRKSCPAQIVGKMTYFFKILANNDGFGIATIEKLYAHDIRSVSQIYALNVEYLVAMGFGEKTSMNLISQLNRSVSEQVEDWRFLAAFGVHRMGLGNCENLLKSHHLNDIFDLNLEQVANIDGFAELTAQIIVQGLASIADEFNQLYQYGFNLETTILTKDLQTLTHELFNKKVVFTGKMSHSRGDMKKHAKSIGIKVSTSISAKIDYLVIGDKVGQNKIQDAENLGVVVMTEADYLSKI